MGHILFIHLNLLYFPGPLSNTHFRDRLYEKFENYFPL